MSSALNTSSPPLSQRHDADLSTPTKRWRTLVIGLFFIGFALRLGTVLVGLYTEYNPYVRLRQGGDVAAYASIAVSLVKGDGFSRHYEPVIADFFQDPSRVRPTQPPRPTASKPVAYPLFVASLFKLFGFTLVPVLVVQALLSSVSTLLVYLIARQIGSPRFAMIPYALSVAYYPFWFKAVLLLSETLLIFSTLVALYGLIRWLIQPTHLRAWWTGVGVGACYLVKPILLPFLPVCLLGAYRHHRRLGMRRAFLIGAVTMTGAIALVLTPLAARNYILSGRLLCTSAQAGTHLLLIHNHHNLTFQSYSTPGFTNEEYGVRTMAEVRPALSPETPPVLAEILIDNAYRRAALAFIAANPGHFMRSLWRSFWNMWRIDYATARPYRKANNVVCYAMLVPFCLLGMGVAVTRRNAPALLLAGFLAYFMAFHAVMAAHVRYRITAMPAFFILASLGLAKGWTWVAERVRYGTVGGSDARDRRY